jgi:hypothetical protein
LRVPDAEPRNGAETCQVQRRPQISWVHVSFQLTVGLVVCGAVLWLGQISMCCDATDRFVARVVTPILSPLVLLALLSQISNDANVVFDHESISKPTWLGKYGVKTLRWEDILHVETIEYRGSSQTEICLYGPGLRITLRPNVYSDRAKFRDALERHLQHVPESQRSFSRRGR